MKFYPACMPEYSSLFVLTQSLRTIEFRHIIHPKSTLRTLITNFLITRFLKSRNTAFIFSRLDYFSLFKLYNRISGMHPTLVCLHLKFITLYFIDKESILYQEKL